MSREQKAVYGVFIIWAAFFFFAGIVYGRAFA